MLPFAPRKLQVGRAQRAAPESLRLFLATENTEVTERCRLDGVPSRCAAAGRHVVSLGSNWSSDAALLHQRDVAASGAPGRTGPRPILRFCEQPATIGICVDGLDFRVNGLGFVPIPIVLPGALPEPMLTVGRLGR